MQEKNISEYLDGVSKYKGNLTTIKEEMSPRTEIFLKTEFTSQEVDEIYIYITEEENREFFFDGSEYNEHNPFISPLVFICEGNYLFALSIEDPENSLNLWAIHKCVDEYPEEGTPLYGLFQMLENDFISQFVE